MVAFEWVASIPSHLPLSKEDTGLLLPQMQISKALISLRSDPEAMLYSLSSCESQPATPRQ